MDNIQKYQNPKNIYKILWDKKEDINNPPKYYRNIIQIDFKKFKDQVFSSNETFAKNLVDNLLNGDVYLLKKAFNADYLKNLREKTVETWKKSKSEFHKIYEGCPNFYRNITPELSNQYSFKQIKQTQYLFPWNSDFYKVYETTYKRWRVLKHLSGFYQDVWEKDTPMDGVVDRIQIVRYPPDSGLLELHQDPYLYQKFFISVYLTKKGVDYKNGGMYFIDENYEKFYLEDLVEIGDMSFGFGTLLHGVEVSNSVNNLNDDISGRWFMGLYSTVSDYVKNRHTGKPANHTIQKT